MILDEALEFGPNWRRPIVELASERCPSIAESDRTAISKEIEVERDEIEDWQVQTTVERGARPTDVRPDCQFRGFVRTGRAS